MEVGSVVASNSEDLGVVECLLLPEQVEHIIHLPVGRLSVVLWSQVVSCGHDEIEVLGTVFDGILLHGSNSLKDLVLPKGVLLVSKATNYDETLAVLSWLGGVNLMILDWGCKHRGEQDAGGL